MNVAILVVALVAVLAVCFAALRFLAYEFDSQVGPCATGRERARRIKRDLVEL